MSTLAATQVAFRLASILRPAGDYDGGATVLREREFALANGTSANQANKMFSDERTLAGDADEDLDLKLLVDANAVAIGLVELTTLMIEASAANTGNIVISPGDSDGFNLMFTGTLILRPGAVACIHASVDPAWAVGASTKVINVDNAHATDPATYRVTLLGRSA